VVRGGGRMHKIGSGTSSVIYDLENNTVLKLFKEDYDEVNFEREYNKNMLIGQTDIKTAKLIGQTEINGRNGIIFEKLTGKSIKELLLKQPWLIFVYAKKFAETHAAMLECECSGLPPQKLDLREFIGHKKFLPAKEKELLDALENMPDGDSVCHNDFSPGNVMVCNGDYYTIDWACATVGDPAMDVADTILKLKVWVGGAKWSLKRIVKQGFINVFMAAYFYYVVNLSDISCQRVRIWKKYLEDIEINVS
jgi:hypothetical protein